MRHQFRQQLERVSELVKLLAIPLQREVPRLDKSAMHHAQQAGLNFRRYETGHGFPQLTILTWASGTEAVWPGAPKGWTSMGGTIALPADVAIAASSAG